MIINGHFAFFCLRGGRKDLLKDKQSDKVNLYMQKFCRKNRCSDARGGSSVRRKGIASERFVSMQVGRSVSFSAQSAGTFFSLSTRYTSACAAPNPSAAHSSISSSFLFIRFPFHKGVPPLTLPRDSVGDTFRLCPRVYAGISRLRTRPEGFALALWTASHPHLSLLMGFVTGRHAAGARKIAPCVRNDMQRKRMKSTSAVSSIRIIANRRESVKEA